MYYIYGKGANDRQFRPMRRDGTRATSLKDKDCMVFVERKDAQTLLDRILNEGNVKHGAKFEIRKK
jgi:hypothetical protein